MVLMAAKSEDHQDEQEPPIWASYYLRQGTSMISRPSDSPWQERGPKAQPETRLRGTRVVFRPHCAPVFGAGDYNVTYPGGVELENLLVQAVTCVFFVRCM